MVKSKSCSTYADIMEKLVYVGRCVKVVKGGRKFTFAAVVIVGDGKGKVGFGLGKAAEVVDAKEKASSIAKKSMIKVPLRDGRTLHYDIQARFGASKVKMRAAPVGTGIIAGGVIRAIFELLGVKDVVAKSIGSTNSHNLIRVAFVGLKNIKSPRYIAEKRGMKISEITESREKFI